MSATLIVTGAAVLVLLGIGHVVFTLQSKPTGGPMMPLNSSVREAMLIESGLGLAPNVQSTLYRAWVGFNLSHSLGVIAVGAVLVWHAIAENGAAIDEPWFVALALGPVAYLVLAVTYWFDKPRNAIAFATVLIWVGVAAELV